jgi:hypothetical protein
MADTILIEHIAGHPEAHLRFPSSDLLLEERHTLPLLRQFVQLGLARAESHVTGALGAVTYKRAIGLTEATPFRRAVVCHGAVEKVLGKLRYEYRLGDDSGLWFYGLLIGHVHSLSCVFFKASQIN